MVDSTLFSLATLNAHPAMNPDSVIQGDARVAALLVAYLIILSVRCETSLSALSDQSMFRIEEKLAKLTFVKYDSACAKRYQYRRVA